MNITSIEYSAAGRAFAGKVVAEPGASHPRPGVLVFHGGAGPDAHQLERARMLAAAGCIAFAPDLFGETFVDRAHGVSVITGLVERPDVLRERVNAALLRLRTVPGVDGSRTAAIGFCFGGLAALELARSGAAIDAVVSFHGGLHARTPARTGEVTSKVLVCTGAADPFVTREHRASFENEMTSAGADWQMITYGGAAHGFTETGTTVRPGCAYHEGADRRSWRAARALFDETWIATG